MEQRPQLKSNSIALYSPNSGDVAVHNIEFITQKVIDIMITFLDEHVEGNSGLANIMFRTDGYPRVKSEEMTSWMFYPDSRTAVCNISDCVDLAIDEALSGNENDCLNVWVSAWLNIISSFFHEVHHAMSFDADRERFLDKDERDREERLADRFAEGQIEVMAKQMDCEPEFSEEINDMISVAVAKRVELILDNEDATDAEMQWCEKVEYMDNHNLVFYAKEDECESKVPLRLATLKEYLHLTSDDAEDDPSWNIPVEGVVKVDLIQEDDDSVAFDADEAEVVEEVPTDAVVVEQKIEQILTAPVDQEEIEPFDVDEGPEYEDISEPEDVIIVNPVGGAKVEPITPVHTAPGGPGNALLGTPAETTVVVGAGMYENLQWPDHKFQGVVKSIYGKIAQHIFHGCAFNPSVNPFFTAKEKIVEVIPLTVDEMLVVRGMDCYGAQGKFRPGVAVEYGISGIFIDKAQTLVGYTLYLNRGDGTQIRRKFVPQNPWNFKKGTQEYSGTALKAQEGNQILWIIDPDAADKQYAARMFNGVLESNIGGAWVAA
jgi:hypothetical protein